MYFTLIAAIGRNNELGKGNDLIWRFKEDMKFFKDNTVGKMIVMGRRTFESLPNLLPYRKHIVLSRGFIHNEDVLVFHSKDSLLEFLRQYNEEVMIIGGESIYYMFIDDANRMLLTEIDDECRNADRFFPSFDKDEWNKNVLSSKIEKGISFQHVEYVRKKTLKK